MINLAGESDTYDPAFKPQLDVFGGKQIAVNNFIANTWLGRVMDVITVANLAESIESALATLLGHPASPEGQQEDAIVDVGHDNDPALDPAQGGTEDGNDQNAAEDEAMASPGLDKPLSNKKGEVRINWYRTENSFLTA